MSLRQFFSIITIIALAAALGGIGYLYRDATLRLTALNTTRAEQDTAYAKTVSSLQKLLSEKDGLITTLQSETESLRGELASITEEAEIRKKEQEAEREAIGKFVTEVAKVQSTDAELLKKYSKNYFLNENYKPAALSSIPAKWLTSKKVPIELNAQALPFLVEMFEDAERDGFNLRAVSGFRSFDEQKGLKSAYKSTFGVGANKFSADQGYSEHQLGTTLDVSTKELDTSYTSIATTKSYEWLEKNAHLYGFVVSYPKGNAYYMYEPWHWRFVGITLATELHEKGKHFYELEQREIDRYIGGLFDK